MEAHWLVCIFHISRVFIFCTRLLSKLTEMSWIIDLFRSIIAIPGNILGAIKTVLVGKIVCQKTL